MANGAQPAGANPSYRIVRELGKRAQRSWAAVRDKSELVVVQRFTKATRPPSRALPGDNDAAFDPNGVAYVAADTMGILLRDARCLSKNWHPNVARVRHVDLVGADLTIATELVDGVTLGDLVAAARAKRTNDKDPVLAFPLLARVVVDVLGGLHGIHGLRDGMNAALTVFHGELCPANVVIGKDGVARVAHVFRPRPVKIDPRSEGLGYASPETLAGEEDQDARADLYCVGAILWEGLTGRRLYEDTDPARLAHRQREEDLAPPNLPAGSAFARLSDVAMKALSFDPANRFRNASEMATEIRRIAGTRLAPGSAVAQAVMDLAGDRIRTRRAELDRNSTGARRAVGAPPPGPMIAAPPAAMTALTTPPPSAAAPKTTIQGAEPDTVPKAEPRKLEEPAPPTARASTSDPALRAAKPVVIATKASVAAKPPGLPPASKPLPPPPPTAAAAKPKETSAAQPIPRAEMESADDLLGPRGSDPNIADGPLAAPMVAALARAATMGKPNGDALALAAAIEVSVGEKSFVGDPLPLAQPPPAPFPVTPSAAPPPGPAKNSEVSPVVVMPRPAAAPFPLTPSAAPPSPPPDFAVASERIEVSSIDLVPPSDPRLAEADAMRRESSGGVPVALSLGPDDDTAASARRRKKLAPLFAAIAGGVVLLLVVSGIAALTGTKDPRKEEKRTTASTATAPATVTATAADTARSKIAEAPAPSRSPSPAPSPPPAPVAPEPVVEPTPARAPEPAPAPSPPIAATSEATPPPRAVSTGSPAPAPAPAAPAKKPKKSSYEPAGI